MIGKDFEVETDVQERFFISPLAQHQMVFRSMLTKKIEKNWKASLGGCYFLQSPQNPNTKVNNLVVPEIRPHVEFKNKQKFGKKIEINQRFRFEARFPHKTNANRTALEDSYSFSNFRFRYQIRTLIPLLKSKSEKNMLALVLADEIMFNFGRNIIFNVFDQNRFFGGLGSQLKENLFLEVGYMNWFQQRSTGMDFYDRDILRFTMTQNIDLRKKSE